MKVIKWLDDHLEEVLMVLLLMAITVLMMLVPLTVFVVSQSNIIETMSTSGMKD